MRVYRLYSEANLTVRKRKKAKLHNDAMTLRGEPWPWTYWGLEPLNTASKDWKQRYATVYLRDGPATAT